MDGVSATVDLGIDIGASSWAVGKMDCGRVSVLAEGALTQDSGRDNLATAIARAVDRGSAENLTVGVAFPGSVSAEGVVTDWPNRPEFVGMSLRSFLGLSRSSTLRVVDDGRAALVGEFTIGIGRGLSEAGLLSFGTGIGGGVMLGRVVVLPRGTGSATIGHIRALGGNVMCVCGKARCLQAGLRTLPDEKLLRDEGLAAWAEGADILAFWADLMDSLGVRDVILTGGRFRNQTLRSVVERALLDCGLAVHWPASILTSPLLGALLL